MNLPKKKSSILTRCPYCEKKIGLDTTKPVLDSEGMKQLADEMEIQIESIFQELDDNPCCAYNRDDEEYLCDTHKAIIEIRKAIKFLRGE